MTLAKLLRGDSYEAQLEQARNERDSYSAEVERLHDAIAGNYETSGGLVGASDSAVDERVREVDRLRMREAGVRQKLREAEALVALLEDPSTKAALDHRDAERQAQADAGIETLDRGEKHLQAAAKELNALLVLIPPALRDPIMRGALVRFAQFLHEPPQGVADLSPAMAAHRKRRLSEIFLGAEPRAKGAA